MAGSMVSLPMRPSLCEDATAGRSSWPAKAAWTVGSQDSARLAIPVNIPGAGYYFAAAESASGSFSSSAHRPMVTARQGLVATRNRPGGGFVGDLNEHLIIGHGVQGLGEVIGVAFDAPGLDAGDNKRLGAFAQAGLGALGSDREGLPLELQGAGTIGDPVHALGGGQAVHAARGDLPEGHPAPTGVGSIDVSGGRVTL